MHRDFDELELYFDPAMVDQVEQEYNHRRIYWKYSIRTIIDNQKNNEKNKRLPFEL
jgi:hypothetical protein